MRIGDDNLFEIGCRASLRLVLYVSAGWTSFGLISMHVRFITIRCRIAERGQLQHRLDARARASHCADIFVLCYWRGLPRGAHGRRAAGRVHGHLWNVRRAAHMERAWKGARGGSATEARRVPPRDATQVQPPTERRSTRAWSLRRSLGMRCPQGSGLVCKKHNPYCSIAHVVPTQTNYFL